jgi:hypothetical protein
MAKRPKRHTIPERVRALEAEHPHVLKRLDQLESHVKELKDLVRQTVRIALLLVVGAVLHGPGTTAGTAFGKALKPLTELFLKAF